MRRVSESDWMVWSNVFNILDGLALAQSALKAGQTQLRRARRLQLNVRRL